MKIRPRTLPPGWYPEDGSATRQTIERYLGELPEGRRAAPAGVAPHAGWEFSGGVALEVFNNLQKDIDTLIVVGGHLGPSDGILAAFEDAYETPLGSIEADLELLGRIGNKIRVREDRYADNTVEVQLPFVRYLFPRSRALSFRAAPSDDAVKLGKAIAASAAELGRKVAVVGSTDLTHYGRNYGFSPVGRGETAVRWVREVNDRGFIDCLLSLKAREALEHARENHSSCSAGGAVAALSFARASGSSGGELLRYMTSYDVFPSESFVGYAGIVFL
jgi:AmmeMemoRadiSam system protein B